MGARIHYVFKDVEAAIGEPSAHVVLYSHWGETECSGTYHRRCYMPSLGGATLHTLLV
jgi:hypothetical protein